MLETVEVRSPSGDLLSLPLADFSSGFIVADIKGLNPVKATIVRSPIATLDEEAVHTTRRDARNLIIILEPEPDYTSETIRDLRFRLYDFFMPEATVNLRFIHSLAEDFEVEIEGVVEDFDWPLFTDEPKGTLSIICKKPDFIALDEIEVEGATVNDSSEILLAYPGSTETGLVFTITIDQADIFEFEFYLRGPDGITRYFWIGTSFEIGDILEINSNPGMKTATVTRAGTPFSLLYGMMPSAPWPTLWKGDNYLRVVETDGTPIDYTVVYKPKYGGL